MLILIMPGVPVRASAVQQDEFPPAGERRGNVGQRGLAHVVVIRRVAAYIDILGRHRHLSIERESPAIWSGRPQHTLFQRASHSSSYREVAQASVPESDARNSRDRRIRSAASWSHNNCPLAIRLHGDLSNDARQIEAGKAKNGRSKVRTNEKNRETRGQSRLRLTACSAQTSECIGIRLGPVSTRYCHLFSRFYDGPARPVVAVPKLVISPIARWPHD